MLLNPRQKLHTRLDLNQRIPYKGLGFWRPLLFRAELRMYVKAALPGLEPGTLRLTTDRSSIELQGKIGRDGKI